MKYLLMIFFLMVNFSARGQITQQYVVSVTEPVFISIDATSPFAGQSSRLWTTFDHFQSSDIQDVHIDYVGNEINVFVHSGGNGLPADPPPPRYVPITRINGLDAGTYTLNYYFVHNDEAFPPSPVNYPNHYIESIEFQVLGSVSIDATSQWSLLLLALLILSASGFLTKRIKL